MKIRQSLAIAGFVTTVGAAGIGGAGLVSAQSDSSSTSSSPMSGLVQKIATKFNLSQDEVQAVFDADKTERDTERKAEIESELSTLVTEGKITADQKQKILDKRTELEAQRDTDRTSMESKTDAERKTAMEAKRTELKKWASDNGISEDYLKYVMGGGHGGGPGGPRPDKEASTSN